MISYKPLGQTLPSQVQIASSAFTRYRQGSANRSDVVRGNFLLKTDEHGMSRASFETEAGDSSAGPSRPADSSRGAQHGWSWKRVLKLLEN